MVLWYSRLLSYINYLAPCHLAPRGLVAQLVEHHTGVVEVWVRFPPKSWNFFCEKNSSVIVLTMQLPLENLVILISYVGDSRSFPLPFPHYHYALLNFRY